MATTSVASSPILSTFPLVPLTTTFTPPAACSGIYTSAGIVVIDDDTSCLPGGFASASTSYFSPGLVCPSGYATACNDNAGVSSVTTVTCCPYRGDVTLGCVTPTTLEGVWEALFCTWIAPETGVTVQVTISNEGGTTSTAKTTMVSPDGINAFGIRMVYESSDLSSAAATTTSSGSTADSTAGTGGMATSTSGSGSGNDGGNDGSSGLSTGTIIAIAVVIPVAICIAAGVFFHIRRQKQAQRIQSTEGSGSSGGIPPPPGSVVAGDQKGYYGAVGQAGSGHYGPNSPGAAPSEVSGVGSYGVRNQYQEAVELGNREPAVELSAEPYR